MALRGIRGATTVNKNQRVEILAATRSLLKEITQANRFKIEDIAAVTFSVTHDLTAEFPALAARDLGWIYTPLLCTNEITVPGSLKKCIRVLILVNSNKKQSAMRHIYLKNAIKLRPDLGGRKEGIYYQS